MSSNFSILPVDNSTGSAPNATNLPMSTVLPSYNPGMDQGRVSAREQDITKMNLGEILGRLPTTPIPNSENGTVLTPLEGTQRYERFNPLVDNEEMYAQEQGAFRQFFGGVTKGLADAGISFAQAMTFQPRNEVFEEAKQKMDELFPNFYSKKQQESNWNWVPFSGGSANFWGDKVFKGTADMAGMIGATMVQAAAIEAVTGGVGEIFAIPEQIGMISLKLSKYLTGIDKTAAFLADAGLEGEMYASAYKGMKGVQAAANGANRVEKFKNLGTNFLFSHYMAAQGEHGVYKATKQELIDKYKTKNFDADPVGQELADIEKVATSIANASYYTDLTLFMGQATMMTKLLRAFAPAKNVVRGTENVMGDVKLKAGPQTAADIDVLTSKTTESGGPLLKNVIKPFGKHAASLGGIIGASETGHEAIKKFFEDKYNGTAKGTVNDAVNDIGAGLAKTFGTTEGIGGILTSALMGGIIGIGTESVGRMQMRKAGVGSIDERTQTAIDNLSGWKVNGLFKNNYQGAIDLAKADIDMTNALKSDDPFTYKNAQAKGFRNFIRSGIRNGMYEVRAEQLRMIKELPDAEIHDLFGEDKTSVADKKAYVDKLLVKAEEVQKTMKALGDIIPHQSRYIAKPKNDAERESNKFYDNVENYKEILSECALAKKEYTRNLSELDAKNKDIHPMLTNDLLERLVTTKGREALRREYMDKISYLDDQLNTKSGSSFHASGLRQMSLERERFTEMEGMLKQIQDMPNLDPIAYSKSFEKVLNFELAGRGSAEEMDSIPMEQAIPLINRGVEIMENKGARIQADLAYGRLFSQDGFGEFVKMDEAARTQTLKEVLVDEDIPTETQGASRMFVMDEKTPVANYKVTREHNADGTMRYDVRDLRDITIKSFDDINKAEAEKDDLNKRLHLPNKVTVKGERNADGTIKAYDEKGNVVNLHPELLSRYNAQATPEEIVNGEGRKTLNAKIIGAVTSAFANAPLLATARIPEDFDVIHEEERGSYAKGPLKRWNENLVSTTTPSKDFPGEDFAGNHVKQSQHFLTNIDEIQRKMAQDPNRGSVKIRLVWSGNEKALGLEGLTQKYVDNDYNKVYDQNHVDEYTVVAVYVEHKRVGGNDEYHYVNAKGERVMSMKSEGGEAVPHEDLVLQTMPTASKNYHKGSAYAGKSRFRPKETDDQIDYAVSQAKVWRESLRKATTSEATGHFSFVVSEGFPDLEHTLEKLGADNELIEMYRPKHSVVGRLIDKRLLDSGENLLTIVTEAAGITTSRGENVKALLGSLWLNHGSKLQYLNNRTLSVKESDTIVKLLENYIRAEEGKKKISRDARGAEKSEKQGHINTINDIVHFLQGTVFFSEKKLANIKGEELEDNNKMFFTSNGVLIVGKKKFMFTSDSFDDVKEMQELKEALASIYTNANTTLLGENKPFNEFYLTKEGDVAQRRWQSYQHYLLSDTYDLHHTDSNFDAKSKEKRSDDDVPFRTSVKAASENKLESNFDGKYAVIQELKEVPVKAKTPPAPEAVAPPVEAGKGPKTKIPAEALPSKKPGELTDEEEVAKMTGPNKQGTEAILRQLMPEKMKEYDTITDAKDKGEALEQAARNVLLPMLKDARAKEAKDSNSVANQEAIAAEAAKVVQQAAQQPAEPVRTFTDAEIAEKFLTAEKMSMAENIVRQAYGEVFAREYDALKTLEEKKAFLVKGIREVMKLPKPTEADLKKVEVKPTEIAKSKDKVNDTPILKSKASNFETQYVPRELYKLAYENDTANKGHQSLDRIIERGGYTVEEFSMLLPDWRNKLSEILERKTEVKAESAPVETKVKEVKSVEERTQMYEKRVAEGEYQVPNSNYIVRVNSDGSFKDSGKYVKDHGESVKGVGEWQSDSIYGEQAIKNAKTEGYPKVREIFEKEKKALELLKSPLAKKILDLSSKLGGGKELKATLEKYGYEKVGMIPHLSTSMADYILNIGDKTKTIEEAIDAELAALNPPAEEKPTGEPKKRKRGPSEYRKLTPGEVAYKIHDEAASLAWAKARVPFSFESMKNLIETTDGGYAFGAYMDDHIKFYEQAKKGTIEHEVGEGIWASFLNVKERKKMLDEFRRRGDAKFTSHETNKEVSYKDATEHEAKEEIMEELGRYVQDGKLYEKPKAQGNFLYRFFRNFIDFFKSLRDGSIKAWFDNINAGQYKTAARVNDYTGKEEYSKVGNLSISDSYAITKGVTVRMMQHLLDDNQSVANFDLKGYSPEKLFDDVYASLEEDLGDDYDDSIYDDFRRGKITETQFVAYKSQWVEMSKNWNIIKKNVMEYMKTFGIKNLEELDELRSDNEFMKDTFKVDNNASMSASMKLMFATMSMKGYRTVEEKGPVNIFGTPGPSTYYTEVIELRDPSTRMPIPVEVSIMVNNLRERLSKVNTLTERIASLDQMVDEDPTVTTLLKRLRIGDTSTPLSKDDLKVIANFNNTFAKQRPNANVHEIGTGFSITYPQNESSTKARQVDAWFDSWKTLAHEQKFDAAGKPVQDLDSIVLRNDKTGSYVFNGEAIKGFDISQLEDREEKGKIIPGQLSFLRKLNIDFTKGMFDKLQGNDPKRFGSAVKKLATYLPGQNISELDSRKTGEAGNLNVISELFLKANGITDSMFYNMEGKMQSQDVGKNYVNSINTDINNAKTKTAFLAKYGHYEQLYRADGIYLNFELFNGDERTTFQISTDYIQGMLFSRTGTVNPVGSMSHPERMLEEINQNLVGDYYVLVGADATTEWTTSLKHIISHQDMKGGRGDKQFYNIFNKYYQTEKAIHDSLPENERAKYQSTMVNDGIVKDYSADKLEEADVAAHLERRAKDMMRYLSDSGQIYHGTRNGREEGWVMNHLNTDWLKSEDMKNNFSDEEMLDFFKFTEANYMINNVELFKLYYGDPAQAGDWLKRVKSSLSPRESSVYGNERFTQELNRNLNTVMGVDVNPLNPRYRQHGDFLKVVNLADHYTQIEHIVNDKYISGQLREAFKRNNDVDGAGWVTPTGHREIMYRRGQVTADHDILYDYMLADDNMLMLADGYLHDTPGKWGYYTEEERLNDRIIYKAGLKRQDGKDVQATYDAVKPIVFGVDTNGKTILNKFALAALSYRQVRGGPFEKLYIEMLKNQDHYAVMESGVKIGLEGTHSIYNEDGTINTSTPAENTRKNISFQYFGIQTEVGGSKFKQSFLTQASVDVYLNSFGGGVPHDFMVEKPDGMEATAHDRVRAERWNAMTAEERMKASPKHALVSRNRDTLRVMQDTAYKGLMKTLGIVDKDGHYSIPDKTGLEELLRTELLRRDTPQNLKDALKLNAVTGKFDTPLEAMANYKQIKDILYSYVDKVICKPKQNGAPYVMQPGITMGKGTAVETRTVKTGKGDKTSFVTDHTDDKAIKFYRAEYDETGKRTKVHPAEIVMNSIIPSKMRKHPRWAKATDEEIMTYLRAKDETILNVVGARIPTQEMNSMEAMTMKAFLPNYQGNAALVSEGMTTKAGLDFDADKMNTYQMNVYMDKLGEVHKVPFFGYDKEAVRAKLEEIAKTIYDEKEEVKAEVTEGDAEVIDEVNEDVISDLFKKSLQNEYYDSMHQIILDPINYERLIRPNSADDGKALANDLEKLAPLEFSAMSKGSLLSRRYMSQQRHYFIAGKQEVAKLAMGQKMHAMYQLSNVYVDPERFGKMLDMDKQFLLDGKLLLATNTVMVKGRELPTISGILSVTGKKHISDSFSQFIDGTVDIAKGAWYMDIVQHPLITSKLATLLHFGVDEDVASDYLNQPIIREFVKMLAAENSTFMFKASGTREREALLELFPTGVKAEEVEKVIRERTREGLDPTILADRIREFYGDDGTGVSKGELSSFEKNIEQHMILQDFLKVAVYDKHLLMLQQGLTYDTKSSGDPNLQMRKIDATQDAREHCVFSSIDEIMKATHIYNLSKLTSNSSEAIAESNFKIGARSVREYINKVLKKLPAMAEDTYKGAASSVEESFLSYCVQTNPSNPINTRIHELLVDTNTNIAKRILEFRDKVKNADIFSQVNSVLAGDGIKSDPEWQSLANNIFLQELITQTENKTWDVKNIFMSRKPKLPQSADTYTDAMREFMDNPQVKLAGLWDDILTTAFLQSGISNSKISFARYIPAEEYARVMSEVVDKIGDEQALDQWVRSDDFFRGNWHKPNIVPRVFEDMEYDQVSQKFGNIKYRLADDELVAWNRLKQQHSDYALIPIKIPRFHDKLDKFTLNGAYVNFKGHENLGLVMEEGVVKGPKGDTYGKGKTEEEAVANAKDTINRLKPEEKDALGMKRLDVPAEDDGFTAPHREYVPFKIRPDSKEGQTMFINFTAQDRSNVRAKAIDPSVKEVNVEYLLKRLGSWKRDDEGDLVYDEYSPTKINGYYIYLPISPLGDGYRCEEHRSHDMHSVLKGKGYQVPEEVRPEEVLKYLTAVQDERTRLREEGPRKPNTPPEDTTTDDGGGPTPTPPIPVTPTSNLVESGKSRTFDSHKDVVVKKDEKSDWKLRVHPDGRVENVSTGKELDAQKDKKLINKAQLKSGFIDYKLVEANNGIKYAVTPEGRVFTMAETNMGTELLSDSAIKKQVVDKYSAQFADRSNLMREEIETLIDGREVENSYLSRNLESGRREEAIEHLSKVMENMREHNPQLTKEQLKEKLECYINAPF